MHAISLARLDVYTRHPINFQTIASFSEKPEAGHFRGTQAGKKGGMSAAGHVQDAPSGTGTKWARSALIQ
jgi:hypothetical protein